MTEYIVPYQDAESEFTEKRSRFITHLYKVETEAEARARIEEMKKKYYDARHNCWCYLLQEGGVVRYSDDGEPQGTAGMPMLDVLRRENLTNVLCVVTRYFGGVLLGTGGLVRAYTKSTQLALENAGINEVNRYAVVLITCPYSLLGTVQNLLPEHNCIVEETDYAADVTLTATLPEDSTAALEQALRDATSANADMEIMDTQFMGRRIK